MPGLLTELYRGLVLASTIAAARDVLERQWLTHPDGHMLAHFRECVPPRLHCAHARVEEREDNWVPV